MNDWGIAMFEHLPIVTDESLNVMIDHELIHFEELLRGCTEGALDLDQAVDFACSDLKESNPNLVKAVRACAFGISETLREDGASPDTGRQAGVLAVPGVLSVLRLIDRAIESEKLEGRLIQ